MRVFSVQRSVFRKEKLTPCLCYLLNSEPLNTEHSDHLWFVNARQICLTPLVKESPCKELIAERNYCGYVQAVFFTRK
jgi:hypothetical protein